jgi:DNA-binding SARP family transcriptional activator
VYNREVLEIRILGPFEVLHDGQAVPLAGQKQRALLAALLLRAPEVVSTDRLIEDLWGNDPPRTAATSLQNFISQLRKTLGSDVVHTRAPGYALDLAAAAVDASLFERALDDARTADPEERVDRLQRAEALWRGQPLAEFAYAEFAQDAIRRLEELRLGAQEDRIDAQLELGKHHDVVAELESLVRQNALRERLRGQLMVALYRAGRQAEALQAYQDARAALLDGLGIDPGPTLQGLHSAILRQDDALSLVTTHNGDSDEDHYDEVVRSLLAGRVVVVLGRGVWEEQLEDGAAEELAARFGLERNAGLTRIAQMVALKQGIGALYDELHDLFGSERSPGRVHEFAAALPGIIRSAGAQNPLLLTTHYDDTLERALVAGGERFDIVSYIASGPNRGKFLHTNPHGQSVVVTIPNTYSDLSLDERPVVVKLQGQVDASPEREHESFVVSEDDYIDYLAQSEIANLVPVTVVAKLRRSHFLFLGYPLQDWDLRVFLHRVWGHERVAYRSWAIEPAPDPFEIEFWRQRGVEIIDVELGGYVERLGRRLRERAPIAA